MLPELGKVKNATGAKAKRVLQWSPRSIAETLIATAESLNDDYRPPGMRGIVGDSLLQ
jgi:hypothetical protein